MRSVHLFNYDWLYCPEQVSPNSPDSFFQPVTIPHSNIDLPHNNFHDNEYQFISTYRKRFRLPEALNGRRVYLDFAGIMTAATVSINGHSFAEQRGGFIPFSYDVTDYLHESGENLLEVSVDSHERSDIPPFGGQVDYLVFGGIYRDVELRYVDSVHIQNVRVKTLDVLSKKPRIAVDVWIVNQGNKHAEVALIGDEFGIGQVESLSIAAGVTQKISFEQTIGAPIELWTLDNPRLYTLNLHLSTGDSYAMRFGFRTAEFRADGFYLNGEKLFLRGLNRHQMFPFIGMAAPQRLQVRDAEIVKAQGCNIVRTSHYPQSKYFLDRCDEIGLLVLEEIPGWQHIGDSAWQDLSLRDVQAMIERDWNHPSIIIWSIRINESWDNDAFYSKTNALTRQLDPTRPTVGVRFWPHSEFLEDIYGYNDFSNGVIRPTHRPWLITEYNGHMYSTKTFDNEERQMEHMLRHARVQSLAMQTEGISGAIAWCAFDYNTHLDFGSGDRVCYHGVMDMFRQPKWAAYVYRSQQAPSQEIVLQAATFWTMGDRAGGGNDPFYVLTNCDSVKVYVGEEFIGTFSPATDEFPNLPYPPVKVKGLGLDWGAKFAPLRLVGLLGEQEVAEQCLSADSLPVKLILEVEDSELHADGMDMTRLHFKITDAYGNRCPYAIQPVTFELLEGDAEIIGENPFALVGGQAALFIKAGRTASTVRLRATTPRLAPVEVTLKVLSAE